MLRRDAMLKSDAVSVCVYAPIEKLGLGTRRIAQSLEISRNNVKSYVNADGWKLLDGQETWRRGFGSDLSAIGEADSSAMSSPSRKGITSYQSSYDQRTVAPYRDTI
jgi:hypothetical protein